MRLENKVAFVSGGARGMGAAEARLFAREGAKVVIGDVLDDEGRQTEAAINEFGGECLYVHLDVTSEESWGSAVAETVNRFGKLDILVNNAGVVSRVPLEDLNVDEWDRVMDINSKGVFLGTKAAIPEMRRSGGGSIVNISSISGIAGQSYVSAVYNASKGAVRIFTKSTAIQYASEGIRANSIHPGPIDTPMTAFRQGDPQAVADSIGRIPLGRNGVPDDVAYGVLYLASDESSFVTGSELVIDGGFIAQ
ncbi:MAG: glucose 1-dehydrogenase [Chloroflexota bacterium]|jgi:cyclopentanol dehydrogenase|nr:cyclopentanol dehydrogenase [Chloroflexota bacterium]MCH2674149.1 glucose 1-dehydrogenase [Dehalococcoidia bacterium]MEC9272774.1 glucose 1-dehydrogenase [Chloroflexota bacterium]MEC9446864.1 glucose 1-dehydrogenase [Chloroflexota bacterium]|tara:strand:+ start:1901 stop:2653 length:753 start_codon:yes stop_codon:yes gene_type:complete